MLRRRAGPAGVTWRVEWNRERREFQKPAAAPLPGAVLPWLPAERLRIARAHAFVDRAGVPYAVIEKVKGANRLHAVDPAAAGQGIEPGMTLADARARVPELMAFDHAPHDDHGWLERLADGCARYTPWVMLDAPDGLVLDVSGCVHFFAGETALAADVVARFERLGVAVSHAFAGNPDAARALARYRPSGASEDEAVRRLPVAALGLDGEATLALKRAGLKTVGDVVVRPLSAITARSRRRCGDAGAGGSSARPTAHSRRGSSSRRSMSNGCSPSRSRAPNSRWRCSAN